MIDPSGDAHHPVPGDEPVPSVVKAAVQFDEQLRGGASLSSTGGEADTPSEHRSLFNCLRFLERAWPRPVPRLNAQQPQRIGRFEVERVLGQGGFGIVYLAHDTALARTVALKIPRLHTLASRSLLERFQREARAAAALDHPHLIPVYDVGDHDGLCYIASAYCPGPNLAEWIRRDPHGVDPQIAARLTHQLADAVAYSHSRGVVHRDIKPSNVMMVPLSCASDRDGLSFSPRLGDFGLAKVLQDTSSPGHGDDSAGVGLLGTPAYMAREQLEGDREHIGPATDVYALGVVLYELLTGRPPYRGSNVVDVLDQVRSSEPIPVRQIRRDVPRDLETICHKCLAKTASMRFDSAASLRDDLQRFLEGLPIKAVPPGMVDVALKWIRRRPAIAALVFIACAALVGMTGLQTWHAARLETKNAQLEAALGQVTEEKAKAVASEDEARGIAYALDIQSAWRAREANDFLQFSRIIDRYRDGSSLARYRGSEWYYLERYTRSDHRTLLEMPHATYDITVATIGQQAVLVGSDAQVRLVDLESGRVTTTWPTHQLEVNSSCLMPDETQLWTAGDDGTVRLWNIEESTEVRRIDAHPDGKTFKVKYSEPLNLLMTCGTESEIRLWDPESGEPAGVLEGHESGLQDVILTPNGRRAISAGDDGSCRVWDLETRTALHAWNYGDYKVRDVTVSPDGHYLACCSDEVHLYDLQTLEDVARLRTSDEPRIACFDQDSRRLYVGDGHGIISSYIVTRDNKRRGASVRQLTQWQGHDSAVYAIRRSPDGSSLLSSGKDGHVQQWYSAGLPPERLAFRHPQQNVGIHAVDPHGHWLLIAAIDSLAVYDLRKPDQAPKMLKADGRWATVAVDRAGELVAIGDSIGGVQIWNTATWKSYILRKGDPGLDMWKLDGFTSLNFSRDGRALAILRTGADAIVVVDSRTGDELQRFSTSTYSSPLEFSPVNDLLMATNSEHRIVQLHWPTGETVWQSDPYVARPRILRFSPDGDELAAETGDRTLRVFDAQTGRLLRDLGQPLDSVMDFAWFPDGRTIAALDFSGSLSFWHAASGQLLFALESDDSAGAGHVASTRDGRWLAVRTSGQDVQLLPMVP